MARAHAEPRSSSGRVVDADGRPVAGATVISGDRSATTDADGRFVIDAGGELLVVADGHEPVIARAGEGVVIALDAADGEVIEIVGAAPEQTTPTEYRLTADEIRRTPGAMNDALRAVTTLPGAARIPYSFGGLVLRGMSPRDTSVFVDGVEIPISFHFGGITAVFPTALLEELRVTPSGFDVSRGRTQGGVIELVTRRPRRDRVRVAGEVSLLHSSATAEGPLGRRGAFLAGVRRSYFDALLRPFLDPDDVLPSYLDGQARAVWGTPATGELAAYALGSLDRLANDEDAATPGGEESESTDHVAMNLGFVRLGADYRRRVGRTTFHAAPFVGTNLLSLNRGSSAADELRLRRRWYLVGARGEWLRDDPGGFVRAGADVAAGYLGRTEANSVDGGGAADFPLPRNTVRWGDAAVWVETRRHWFGDRVSVRPGLRLERFGLGNQTALDPRLNAHVALSGATTLRASVGRFHQPPSAAHFDQFSDNLAAASSYVDQTTVAVEWQATPALETGLVAFWHEGRRTLIDAPGAEGMASPPALQDLVFRELVEEQFGFYGNQVNDGGQRSYGAELSVRYTTDRLRVLANYAWSRAKRRGAAPDDAWTPYGLDQPQRLNLVVATTARRWNVGVRLTAVSGNPARLWPEGTPFEPPTDSLDDAPVTRLPTFWQVDLRVDRAWRRPWGTVSLFFDIINATHHRNVEWRARAFDPAPGTGQTWQYKDEVGLPILPTIGVELISHD